MSKKPSTIYACSHCDAQFPKWIGRCSECGSWGTVSESVPAAESRSTAPLPKVSSSAIVDFTKIEKSQEHRLTTGISEFDRILGGGIVPGSLTLLGGEPGVGKSTLVLHLCQGIQGTVLYISGEESAGQIKLRVDRLGISYDTFKFIPENNIEKICSYIHEVAPHVVVIDSIQTMYSSELPSEPGAVNQVRVSTVKLLEIAKKTNTAIIIVGHVTKEGTVAGPKTLEHLVDTVLYIEGSAHDDFRIVRSIKNRFGSTNDIGVFEMTTTGLSEVSNPSLLFMTDRSEDTPGSVTTCTLEGTRPFFVEIQSLVSKTVFGYPQRKASGYDQNRLQMLTAVLTKRLDLPLLQQDIHLNVTGGYKVSETAADLAVCMAIMSSYKNKIIPTDTIVIGEVGLGGEIRPVSQLERRIEEAGRMNFSTIICPKTVRKKSEKKIVSVKNLSEALQTLF